MENIVEAEFSRKQSDLEQLASGSRESITTLASQTRTELLNFQQGVSNEVNDMRSNLTKLRSEAAEAVGTLATGITNAKTEQLGLKLEAERVVKE